MKAGKQEEDWAMRADEVRRMLGIGRNTLYLWCELGIIPHKRVGRVILFSKERLREWLNNNDGKGGTK